MKILGYQFTKQAVAVAPKKQLRPSGNISATPIDRIAMQMDTLKSAVDSAIDIYNPDRRDLIGIYENVAKDPHVISQLEIAYNKVVSQPFALSKDGNDDEEATQLLKREWFEDFQKICIDPEFWGYTLAEFDLINADGEFTGVDIIPRRNVLPFSNAICLDARSPNGDGVRYYEDKGGVMKDLTAQLFLIELGKADKLGKFETVAREVIWKNFANTDWSQGSEKFGMPLLDIAANTDDPNELNRLEAMARNFGSNRWMLRGITDNVQIVQAQGNDFFQIYKEKILMCDEQISKCMNGTTGVSDQQAYVGAAEVHERTTDDFHHARMRRVTNIVNGKLLPFLTFHGYPLDGYQFRYLAFDPKPVETGQALSPDDDGAAPQPAKPKKAPASLRPW